MSAMLALDLDHDAIRLLSRQSDGWVVEAVAELNAADITDRMAALRTRAEDLAGADPAVTLVLPRSQVLYTSFEGDASETADRLEGITPYAVSDITWDTAVVEGRVKVAAVAYETLEEAMQFARASRFDVLGLTSEPPEGLFPRLPVFTQANAPQPMVLTPDTPPERAAVAFSSQRARDYGPRGALRAAAHDGRRLHLKAAAQATANDAGVGAALLARLQSVPRHVAAAGGVAALGLLAFLLWPASDPDPFTKRGFDPSFTALPTAMGDGLSAPEPGSSPALNPIETAALSRTAPGLGMPVINGSSGIATGDDASGATARRFAMVAARPLPDTDSVAVASASLRPTLSDAPILGLPPAIETATFAPADGPQALAPAPIAGRAPPRPGVMSAGIATRQAAALTIAPEPEVAAATLDPLPDPVVAPEAPQRLRSAPAETAGYVAAAAPRDPDIAGLAPRLPDEGDLAARLPDMAMTLPAPGLDESFDVGADGFVAATPDGARTQDGVLVFAGAPAKVAPARPVPPEPVTVAVNVGPASLAAVLPRARPVGATSQPAPAQVAAVQPDRPAVTPGGVAIFPETTTVPDALIAEALEGAPDETAAAPTGPVLTSSLLPRPRPQRSAPAPDTQATRAVAVGPRIPSSANVAREATVENGIRFQRINLVGVFGAPNDRRALVRLPSGKFIKLQVGDRLDGGQVARINSDALIYRKGGRNLSLALPNT